MDAEHRGPQRPVRGHRGAAGRARAGAGPGRPHSRSCTPGRSPSSTPTAARRWSARSGVATPGPRERRSGCSATSSATMRATARAHRPGGRSAGGSASGSWARRARCSCARAAAACTAGACAPRNAASGERFRNDPSLPSADRTAHLLLALREDEIGFATVANLAFSGATWRVRRRLAPADAPRAARCRAARAGLIQSGGEPRCVSLDNGPSKRRPFGPDHACHDLRHASRPHHSRPAPRAAPRARPGPGRGDEPSAATGSPGCGSSRARSHGRPRFAHLKHPHD